MHAEVDDRDEHPPSCSGHRRLDAAEQARADAHASPRQQTCVVAMHTDARRPQSLAGRAVPRDHEPGLAGAENAIAGNDRTRLEVVVADVVRRHLVVPEQPAGARVEHEQRVRVRDRPRECGSVRPLRGAAPRRRIRVARVEVPVCVDGDRVPHSAAAGLERMPPRVLDRHELPADRAGRPVERVDRAAAGWGVPHRAEENEPSPGNGCDVDKLLRRAREMTVPELATSGCVERECVGVGCAVNP